MSVKKSMWLTSSTWEDQYESFRLFPITEECPYTEVFYDPEAKVLVLFAKEKREHFTMMERLDEFGHPLNKRNKPLMDRFRVSSYQEYFIEKEEEIKQFVNAIAENADMFPIDRYFEGLIEVSQRRKMHRV